MNSNPAKKTNVFFNRNFRLIFLGALVSELGALLYSFAVGFYILQISNNNAFLQGLYLALNGIALLVFTPVGGVLGDRFNKAKIMYLCDFLKGGGIILATVLMLLFPDADTHIVILFVLGILGNIVSGIFTPAAGAMLPHILEEQKLAVVPGTAFGACGDGFLRISYAYSMRDLKRAMDRIETFISTL